jgi:hypothetical protein
MAANVMWREPGASLVWQRLFMRPVAIERPFSTAPLEPEALALALFSAGDERVFVDPATGRTKYGTPQGCAEDEIWFSSSTASAISPRGHAAAASLWQDLVAGRQSLEDSCDDIRNRLTALFGIAETQTILTGSGTEAVLISAVLMRLACSAPVTTIIVGNAETGRGVAAAAGGKHFLRYAAFGEVVPGARLAGLDEIADCTETVEIRDSEGVLRADFSIETELAQKIETARRAGRDVVIHSLDISKTGQSKPRLAALAQLCAAAPDHVFALADCCQLRCSAEHIRSLLTQGCLVAVTGSKFAGGPSFCGALLLPPAIVQRLQRENVPAGLAAYSARFDWPAQLRAMLPLGVLPATNMGLALRWQAALAEIERFFAWPAALRNKIMLRFYEEVAWRVTATAGLDLLAPCAASADSFGHTILSIAMRHPDGRCFDMAEATAVQRRLRDGSLMRNGLADTCFHLGQPVEIGSAGLLRLCASAPLLNPLAEAIADGASLSQAFDPMTETIGDLFRVLSTAMARAEQ